MGGVGVIARIDTSLVAAWLVLVVVGIVMVSSATASEPEGSGYYLAKHGVFVVGAMIVVAGLAWIPLRVWEIVHVPCLVLAVVLCALVLVPGVSQEINGSRRWVELGVIRLQPAEAAKFLVVVYLAGCVARAGDALSTHWQLLLKPVGWVVVVLVLILCQPDFGSVVLLALLTGGIFFLGGARLRDFLLLAVLGGVALAAVAVVQPYRVERLMTFMDPWATPFGSGYQLTQALIAFGSGGFFGLGIGEGVQKLFYLPYPHNDFIYAVIAEELGMVGAVAVLALLVALTVRICRIGRDAVAERRVFAGMLAYGAALLLGMQTVFNVGVNTGMLPTKGLTLPFVSFGGNSLLVCSALVALALRAHYERRLPPTKPRPDPASEAADVAA
ncbi:MAG: putative lipid II flippase FtsW [Gammaproteobacteria bacterium]|nr:putative lipid II flippase FtsW [Gammaproteobacteria bacterium]MYK48594.1 putative lipid II flippase FtsW [Gammaproteobacteria bacterium]